MLSLAFTSRNPSLKSCTESTPFSSFSSFITPPSGYALMMSLCPLWFGTPSTGVVSSSVSVSISPGSRLMLVTTNRTRSSRSSSILKSNFGSSPNVMVLCSQTSRSSVGFFSAHSKSQWLQLPLTRCIPCRCRGGPSTGAARRRTAASAPSRTGRGLSACRSQFVRPVAHATWLLAALGGALDSHRLRAVQRGDARVDDLAAGVPAVARDVHAAERHEQRRGADSVAVVVEAEEHTLARRPPYGDVKLRAVRVVQRAVDLEPAPVEHRAGLDLLARLHRGTVRDGGVARVVGRVLHTRAFRSRIASCSERGGW